MEAIKNAYSICLYRDFHIQALRFSISIFKFIENSSGFTLWWWVYSINSVSVAVAAVFVFCFVLFLFILTFLFHPLFIDSAVDWLPSVLLYEFSLEIHSTHFFPFVRSFICICLERALSLAHSLSLSFAWIHFWRHCLLLSLLLLHIHLENTHASLK